jgi:protein-S-isoprenylcysteine O-methyltransferase Ste14
LQGLTVCQTQELVRVDVVENGDDGVMFPRLIPLSVLVVFLAGLLQWILPLNGSSDLAFVQDVGTRWLSALGAVLAATGIAISLAGYRALRRRGADVEPLQPAPALVTDGIFAWTRNPCYLGWLIALFGIALIFVLYWLLILIVPTWTLLNFAVVRAEERHLAKRFGEAYADYLRHVPRYLSIH